MAFTFIQKREEKEIALSIFDHLSPVNSYLFPPLRENSRTDPKFLSKYPGNWSENPFPHYRISPFEIISWLKEISKTFQFDLESDQENSVLTKEEKTNVERYSNFDKRLFFSLKSTHTRIENEKKLQKKKWKEEKKKQQKQQEKQNEKKESQSETQQVENGAETKETKETNNKNTSFDLFSSLSSLFSSPSLSSSLSSPSSSSFSSPSSLASSSSSTSSLFSSSSFSSLSSTSCSTSENLETGLTSASSLGVCIFIHQRKTTIECLLPQILTLCLNLQMNLICLEYPGYSVNWNQTCTLERLQEMTMEMIRTLTVVAHVPLSKITICGAEIGAGIAIRIGRLFPRLGGILLVDPWTSTKEVLFSQLKDQEVNLFYDIPKFDTFETPFEFRFHWKPASWIWKFFDKYACERMPNMEDIKQVFCPVQFVCTEKSIDALQMTNDLYSAHQKNYDKTKSQVDLEEKNLTTLYSPQTIQAFDFPTENSIEAGAKNFRGLFSFSFFDDEEDNKCHFSSSASSDFSSSSSFDSASAFAPHDNPSIKRNNRQEDFRLDEKTWKKISEMLDANVSSCEWAKVKVSKLDKFCQWVPYVVGIFLIVAFVSGAIGYSFFCQYRNRKQKKKSRYLSYSSDEEKSYIQDKETQNEREDSFFDWDEPLSLFHGGSKRQDRNSSLRLQHTKRYTFDAPSPPLSPKDTNILRKETKETKETKDRLKTPTKSFFSSNSTRKEKSHSSPYSYTYSSSKKGRPSYFVTEYESD